VAEREPDDGGEPLLEQEGNQPALNRRVDLVSSDKGHAVTLSSLSFAGDGATLNHPNPAASAQSSRKVWDSRAK
jgi:hypothetical protein